MARRARGTPPPKAFDKAWPGIDKLEHNVIQRMVTAAFTGEDALRWMYPDHVIDKLKAAFPYTRQPPYSSLTHAIERMVLPSPIDAYQCTLSIDCKSLGILVPLPDHSRPNDSREAPIIAAVQEALDQHRQFEKLRRVVRWLNAYGTLGAGRHFCPWLTSIMPEDHEFHKLDGVIYREPNKGMNEIMEDMRASHTIMASALLAGDYDHSAARTAVRVQFHGQRQLFNSNFATEGYTSNQFGIV